MKIEKVDFAIITILPEEENAVLTRFTYHPYTDPSSKQSYGISQVQTRDGKNCTVAIARTVRQGNDASQRLAHSMIDDLDPQMLLVVGIGGGVPDNEFTLGDVIISSHIHNFDVNALKGSETTYDVRGGIHPFISNITANLYLYQSSLADWNSEASIGIQRPHLYLTEKRLKDRINKDVDEQWQVKVEEALKWQFDKNQRGARPAKFLPGTIASSNTLVRSDAILAQWLKDARSTLAVEMEVAGVYEAAQRISRQYPVMAIRGISDIIGFERDDNWKLYACHTAAAFAHAFITAGIVEPRGNSIAPERASMAFANLPHVQPSNTALEEAPMPAQNIQNANAIKIFTIYAPADKLHKERLETQLFPYTLSGMMDLWDRDRINPAAGLIQQEIDKHIDSSQVILLLVSPHFSASKQCLTEMARAMQRRITGKIIIIPINIRPTDWPEAPFEGLLALPRNGRPVNSWSNTDEAWYDVAVDIRKACQELRKPRKDA
jgi:nucleoside phosphorylase